MTDETMTSERIKALDAGAEPQTPAERGYALLGCVPGNFSADEFVLDSDAVSTIWKTHGWRLGAARMLQKPLDAVTDNDAARFRVVFLQCLCAAEPQVAAAVDQFVRDVYPELRKETANG